jgi:hypothetical protein
LLSSDRYADSQHTETARTTTGSTTTAEAATATTRKGTDRAQIARVYAHRRENTHLGELPATMRFEDRNGTGLAKVAILEEALKGGF